LQSNPPGGNEHRPVPDPVEAHVEIRPPLFVALTDPNAHKEKLMEARKVAAQFAAYVWYENTQAAKPSEDDRARFARDNWMFFLPVAPEGLGRLLLQIAADRPSKHRARKHVYRRELVAAG
jgi:hypothetical protein